MDVSEIDAWDNVKANIFLARLPKAADGRSYAARSVTQPLTGAVKHDVCATRIQGVVGYSCRHLKSHNVEVACVTSLLQQAQQKYGA